MLQCLILSTIFVVLAQSSLTFLVIGDWGAQIGYDSHPEAKHSQLVVRDTMTEVAEKNPIDFVLNTGDNFYPAGVESTSDAKWNADWVDVYNSSSLKVDWWNVLGNHDWMGSVKAQIKFSKENPRWKFPNNYYTVDFVLSKKHDTNVTFFFLDTTPFTDGVAPTNNQLSWFEEALETSKNEWKIVVGHHPIYNSGMEDIQKLIIKHKVQAYFNGHNHQLNYYTCPSSNTDYFTSGAGCRVPVTMQSTQSSSCPFTFSAIKAGFFLVNFHPTHMTTSLISTDSTILFTKETHLTI